MKLRAQKESNANVGIYCGTKQTVDQQDGEKSEPDLTPHTKLNSWKIKILLVQDSTAKTARRNYRLFF